MLLKGRFRYVTDSGGLLVNEGCCCLRLTIDNESSDFLAAGLIIGLLVSLSTGVLRILTDFLTRINLILAGADYRCSDIGTARDYYMDAGMLLSTVFMRARDRLDLLIALINDILSITRVEEGAYSAGRAALLIRRIDRLL